MGIIQKKSTKYFGYLLLVALLIFNNPLSAQNVGGEYYGVGNVSKDGNYSQYLSELVLRQKGNKITGEYNYYFKADYISQKVTGYYDAQQRLVVLQLIPLLHYQATDKMGVDCIMKGYFFLKTSRVETTLQGHFEATDRYMYTCPNINLKFTKDLLTPEQRKALNKAKEQEYLAEELEEQEANKALKKLVVNNNTAENLNNGLVSDTNMSNATNGQLPHVQDNFTINNAATLSAIATIKPDIQPITNAEQNVLTTAVKPEPTPALTQAQKNSAMAANAANSAKPGSDVFKSNIPDAPEFEAATLADKTVVVDKTKATPDIFIKAKPAAEAARDTTPANFTPALLLPLTESNEEITKKLAQRTFEESKVILIDTDSLQITLYDNGEVDGDTIALFDNRRLIARNQFLNDQPFNLTIAIDTTVHEISMYAQNLGRIPPNTALCIFMAGNQRYELILTSDLERNGTIKFRKRTQLEIEEENKYFK